jgi:hypothetical protein
MKVVAYAPPVLLGVAAIVAAGMNAAKIPSGEIGLLMGAGVGALIGIWLAIVYTLLND